MARRIPLRLVILVSAVLAACQTQPTGPAPSKIVLLDTEEGECVDTVYEPAARSLTSADSGSATLSSSTDGCYIVVIYY